MKHGENYKCTFCWNKVIFRFLFLLFRKDLVKLMYKGNVCVSFVFVLQWKTNKSRRSVHCRSNKKDQSNVNRFTYINKKNVSQDIGLILRREKVHEVCYCLKISHIWSSTLRIHMHTNIHIHTCARRILSLSPYVRLN